jgi:Domain of unknown function (DUF1992)
VSRSAARICLRCQVMPVSSVLPFTVTGRSYPIDAASNSLSVLLLWWGNGAGMSGGEMTERKPAGVNFESWIDKQIREATERGEFDNLPGAGKPLPGRNEPYDGEWWLRDYLSREGAPLDELLPTPLRLRKVIQRLPETVRGLRTEQSVRDAVADVNEQVRAWWRSSVGPQAHVGLVDVEEIVAGWQASRPKAPEPTAVTPAETARRRWWRRSR